MAKAIPLDRQIAMFVRVFGPKGSSPADRKRQAQLRAQRLAAARGIAAHTEAEWMQLVLEFQGKCVKCGIFGRKLTRDHIIPISQGGSDGIGNIQPMCLQCNSGKGGETFNWLQHRREHGFE